MRNKINFYDGDEMMDKTFPYFKGKKNIKRILNEVSKDKGNAMSLSIHLCDSNKIRSLNLEHRGKDSATDVLSFPHNEKEGKHIYIGDVFINKDILESQAEEINSDPLTEFTFLALHGILHLVGYDHMTEIDEEEMTLKQREIFISLKIREW